VYSKEASTGELNSKSIWAELKGAGVVAVAIVALVIVGLFAAVLLYGLFNNWWKIENAGTFGDSFGVLTAFLNALAFAAVVATVVLQSRELRESRQEMEKQAIAQQAWADAATRQIELTKQLESTRIRPFLKAALSPTEGGSRNVYEYWVRNVGLGVAFISHIELLIDGEPVRFISHNHDSRAQATWEGYVRGAVGAKVSPNVIVSLMQFNDSNRALAPGEKQRLILLAIRGDDDSRDGTFSRLQNQFHPKLYFVSADGSQYSTTDQYKRPQLD
jgi:hypothetical protein